MSSRKRETPFNPSHELEYGLKISTREPSSGAVTSVACRFCQVWGREEKVGQKRKAARTTKYFKLPYRPELYMQHLQSQHSAKWNEYRAASLDAKKSFFDATAFVNTLHAHFVGSGGQLYFDINVTIVDTMIRTLLFDAEAEEISIDRALSLFEPIEADNAIVYYRVHIKNIKLFMLVVGIVGLGSSFRLTARQVQCAREELALGYLDGCNEAKVSSFVRVAAAVCLQKLSDILADCWAFSVAFDSSTVATTSYFDVRVRFVKGTRLYCFHLCCLPIYGRHTGDNLFETFEKAMNAICPSWGYRLLSTCSDGARIMTGRVRGIVTRVSNRVEQEGCHLIRFWCGAHQLDLVVQNVVSAYLNEEFYSMLTATIGYLRRQQNLVNEMKSKCPKVAATRWLSLGKVLPWFSTHRCRIIQYLDQNNRDCKPTSMWWISVLSLSAIVAEIDILFKTLQHSALLVPQQEAAFCRFIQCLKRETGMQGPLSESQLLDQDSSVSCRKGPFMIAKDVVVQFFRGCGSFVATSFDSLPAAEKNTVVCSVGNLVVCLAAGIDEIEPERDSNNAPAASLPPCLPREYATMLPSVFVDLVIRFRSRLEKHFSNGFIDALEREQKDLRIAYQRENVFRETIDRMPESIGFHEAWSTFEHRFPKLCTFAGGCASVYPGTTRVESDFSVINWEKDDFRSSLMNFSLEGIMHCKQFKAIEAI